MCGQIVWSQITSPIFKRCCCPLSVFITFNVMHPYCVESLRWLSGKESSCQCRSLGFDPWVGKIPCRRKWQPTPVFLPGKSRGQKNLEGYRLWAHERVGHDLATKQQHISDIIWYLSFSFWFASLSVVISSLQYGLLHLASLTWHSISNVHICCM